MIFLGVILIIVGLVSIFAPELVWQLTHFQNQLQGKASERSDTWEMGRVISGVSAIILGLILTVISFQ